MSKKISQMTDGGLLRYTDQYPILRSGANFRAVGVSYINDGYIIVPTTSNPALNGLALGAAIEAANALTPNGLPLSATNRATVILPPGQYGPGLDQFGEDPNFFGLTTNYVDLIGLTGDPKSVLITSQTIAPNTGTLVIVANFADVKGVTIQNTASTRVNNNATDACAVCLGTGLAGVRFIDCIFDDGGGASWSMRLSTTVDSTFINVASQSFSFGFHGDFTGIAIECTSGDFSFGYAANCSGVLTDCTSGDQSYGAIGIASGRFFRCYGNAGSFGGGGAFSGIAENCRVKENGFGNLGTFSGQIFDCVFDKIPQQGEAWAPTTFTGLVSRIRFAQLADDLDAVIIPNGATGNFEFCTFIATGTGTPLDLASGSATINFSYCKFNNVEALAIAAGITNGLGATFANAFNIGSAAVV